MQSGNEKVLYQKAKLILKKMVKHAIEKDIPAIKRLIAKHWQEFWSSEVGQIIKNLEKVDTISMAIQVGFVITVIFILANLLLRRLIAKLVRKAINKAFNANYTVDDVEVLFVGPFLEEAFKTFILEISANEKIAHIMLAFFSIAEYLNKIRVASKRNQAKEAAAIGVIAIALHHLLLKIQYKIREKLQTKVGKIIAFLCTLAIHILYNYTVRKLASR